MFEYNFYPAITYYFLVERHSFQIVGVGMQMYHVGIHFNHLARTLKLTLMVLDWMRLIH